MGLSLDQVAEVLAWLPAGAGKKYGTGYLVGDRLVLTCGHALTGERGMRAETVRVRFRFSATGPARWFETEQVWVRNDDLDGALLLIKEDQGWTPPSLAVRTRWGRLVTSRAQMTCTGAGFPLGQEQRLPAGDRLDVLRDTEQFGGTTSLGTKQVQNRYEISVTDAAMISRGDTSRWTSQSGTAVFLGDPAAGDALLSGVVIEDPDVFGPGTRLTAIPIAELATDDEFREAILEHTGLPLVLEPVELAGLFEDPNGMLRPAPGFSSPGYLLRAEAEVVDFHGRTSKLRELTEHWCSGNGVAVRLMTGEGGQGKTRLARQVTAIMREHGWVVGHLGANVTVEQARLVINQVQHPLLVVVDYAETRPKVVTTLIAAAAAHQETPVRILLLARGAGAWWTSVHAHGGMVADTAIVEELGPVEEDHCRRPELYRSAATCFARRFGQLTTNSTDWNLIVSALPMTDQDLVVLDDDRYTSVLSVHMAALADLLQASPHAITMPPDTPAEEILMRHERVYWEMTAADPEHGVGFLIPAALDEAVTTATLCSALTENEALSVLAAVPELESLDAGRLGRTARWLRRVYPAPIGSYWGTLQPDRLGEHLVGSFLNSATERIGEYLTRLVPAMSPAQSRHALTVVGRAHAQHGLQQHLDVMLTVYPNQLMPAAVEVQPQMADPQPIAQAIKLGHRAMDDSEAIQQTGWVLQKRSTTLGAYAAQIVAHAAEHTTDLDSKAEMWARQANYLTEAGEHHAAMEPARKAVALARWLTDNRSAMYRYRLANCLNIYGRVLADAGDPQPDICREALRHLDMINPSDLNVGEHAVGGLQSVNGTMVIERLRATLMGNLSNEHTDPQQSLVRAKQALDIRLNQHAADASDADLARAHYVYGLRLGDTDQVDEGVKQLRHAVAIYTRLVRKHPDVHRLDLAQTYDALAGLFDRAGQRDDALAAARQAVDLYRALAARLPKAHMANFAHAAAQLHRIMDSGPDRSEASRRAALDTLIEATVACRAVPARTPHDAEEYVIALTNLSYELFCAERGGEAVSHIDMAEVECRRLCGMRPEHHDDLLALTLATKALVYARYRPEVHALEGIAAEADNTYQLFSARHPDRCNPELGERVRYFVDGARARAAKYTDFRQQYPSEFGSDFDPATIDLNKQMPPAMLEATQLLDQASAHGEECAFEEAARCAGQAVSILRSLADRDECQSMPSLQETDFSEFLARLSIFPAGFCAIQFYLFAATNLALYLSRAEVPTQAELVLREAVDLAIPNHVKHCADAYAVALQELGHTLIKQERYQEASSVFEQSIGIWRTVVHAAPHYQETFVNALTTAASLHEDLGDPYSAHLLIREAVEVCREGVIDDPQMKLTFLRAQILSVRLLDRLRQVDDEALETAVLAWYQYGQLTADEIEEIQQGIAQDLPNVILRFHRALGGNPETDLTDIIVGVYRKLYDRDPDTHIVGLAQALWNLGSRLANLRDDVRAHAIIKEAVGLYRRLDATDSDHYRADLATIVGNLGLTLIRLQRHEQALQVTTEAADLWRHLAAESGSAHEPSYAWALGVFADARIAAKRNWAEALDARRAAVDIYRRLAEHTPHHRINFADALTARGILYSRLERFTEAKADTTKAVNAFRALMVENPDLSQYYLAAALAASASIHIKAGDDVVTALLDAGESVDIYHQIRSTHWETYLQSLRASYLDMADALATLGRHVEADQLRSVE
jgi:tetratricopeptide (TPR) repeat protein